MSFKTHSNFKSVMTNSSIADANDIAQSIGIEYKHKDELFVSVPFIIPWESKLWFGDHDHGGSSLHREFKIDLQLIDRLYYIWRHVRSQRCFIESRLLIRMDFTSTKGKYLYAMLITTTQSINQPYRFDGWAFVTTDPYLIMRMMPWKIIEPIHSRDRIYESLAKDDIHDDEEIEFSIDSFFSDSSRMLTLLCQETDTYKKHLYLRERIISRLVT